MSFSALLRLAADAIAAGARSAFARQEGAWRCPRCEELVVGHFRCPNCDDGASFDHFEEFESERSEEPVP